MRDRRSIDELTLAELEQLLLTRRREERMQRLRERGVERELPDPVVPSEARVALPPRSPRPRYLTVGKAPPSWKARLLTVVEVLALVAFVVAGGLWYWEAKQTDLVSEATVPETVTAPAPAPEALTVLPGNPSPPGEETPIPPIYQEWIQPASGAAAIPLGDQQSEQRPTRIVIPKIQLDAPVVLGDDWESLKRGAGHHPGSAFPGERGNMVISAHNDIFGELFRHLEQLEPGDEFMVYDAANREYRYVVRTRRIVEPTEVSVLNSAPEPLATLITCHPYLIDSQRLVVQAELQQ